MIRILGIDPGTLRCGYGVIEVPSSKTVVKPRYVECGVLVLDGKLPLASRLCTLAHDLREVIGELKPDELSLESAFHGINARSALVLGHARGVIMLVGAEANLPIGEYSPATVKRAVAGHGRATKQDVQKMVSWLCGLSTPPPSDAADAVAIALCHAFHRRSLARRADAVASSR